MGFCKPGDPCFGVLGGFSLQRILDYQNEGRNKAEDCGIDTSSLDFCTQINNCITGSSVHTSLTACTIWSDMIIPCDTGTTVDGLLQVTGVISAQTDTYIHGHIYSGTTNLLDMFCAKPCGSGGGGVGLNDGYWSANTAGGISNSGGTRVGIGTTTPSSLFEVKNYISFHTADQTTRIGYNAGQNWEATSDGNTMVGHYAGGTGTWNAAGNNTAVGYNAATFLSEGDNNTAIGSTASGTLSTGSDNTLLGYTAGYSLSTDSKNTAIGSGSHYYPYLGGSEGTDGLNTAVGYRSMHYPNRGYKNVAIGAESLHGSSSADIGNQGAVAVGYGALTASKTGDYNIAIGYKAADNITTGDNNISIGKDADPPSATASYQMNIGGIIHGQDAYSDSAISQVGVGTTAPKVKLDVWHDPTNLVAGTGGGEVVTFGGTNVSDLPVAGKLMYLNTGGTWRGVDADNVNKGGDELLAIALGVLPSEGMLLRGFFNAVDSGSSGYLIGAFVKGASLYVGETVSGYYSFTAPNDTNDYIRVIGYGTNTANIIYFNPDNTHIKLA